ncbi:60S ribosomal protein L23a-like [Rousettus aegyptiacus]|uniref:60S ribosomal protein L23a-like n=1 Tax=Rousettus aegyptiacus TaxID=9407 RepID=UPI00168D7FFF|nr:60S ribosomal protein L23a-like [Rousettus aegyptiacus]
MVIKKVHISPPSDDPRCCSSKGSPIFPGKTIPRKNELDHYAIIKFPLTTKKKIENNSILACTVDAKANKHQIKQAVRKLCDINVAKINIPIRPNGEKNAYIQLAPAG